jgi:hypothetical protein
LTPAREPITCHHQTDFALEHACSGTESTRARRTIAAIRFEKMRMARAPHDKTYDDLAHDMCAHPASPQHLAAKAEMARRAVVQDRFRSWMMLLSTGIAAVAAIASACSAYFAYYIATH